MGSHFPQGKDANHGEESNAQLQRKGRQNHKAALVFCGWISLQINNVKGVYAHTKFRNNRKIQKRTTS